MAKAQQTQLSAIDLRTLLEHSPVVHYLARPASPFALSYVGSSTTRLTGYPAERFAASPAFWLEHVHPDDQADVLVARTEVVAGRKHQYEYRFQHASGDWVWLHDECTVVRDPAGNPLWVSGVWLDITEHKSAQRLLEKQRAFAEGLVANAPTIVLILDHEGRILKVNPYFERKTGYRSEEIVHGDWFQTMLPSADQKSIRALFEEVLEQGMIAGHVNPVAAKDGSLLEIEWFGQVLTDAAGQFNGLLCIGHDVTERMGYERALEESRREAERANAAKSRFLVTASHDLRQPLQTLLLLNGALRKTAQGARQQDMLEMQQQALQGMSSLLNALLDIGKLESGAVRPQLGDVAVSAIFRHIEAELALQARAKGLELRIEDGPWTAFTDAELLTQLVRNVVANAIRYTNQGEIKLCCQRIADQLQIKVEDTGIGISPEQRESIFDEFYQIDRAASRGGLGLGLSIVKRIAALLDIGIEIESEIGRGSAFIFTLAQGARALPEQSRQPAAVAGHGGTVLLIDDDPAVLAASQLFLELEGYEVVAAASPREARAALAAGGRPIDIIITDFHLNQTETGIDIITAVREQLERAVPAIIVTGDTSPAVGKIGFTACEIMSKPIDTRALLATAARMLAPVSHTKPH